MTFLLADVIRWKWFLQWFLQRFSAVLRPSHTVAVNTSIWTTFLKKNKYVHSCSEKWLLAACHDLSKRPGLCGSWHQQWLTWAQALRERDLIKEMWHHAAVRKMFLKVLAAQSFSNRCFTAIWVCLCVYVCEEGEILSKYIKVMLSRKFPIIANNLSWMDLNLCWCSCLIAKLGELLPLKEAKITVPLTTILHKRRNPDVHFLLLPKKWVKSLFGKRKIDLFIYLFALITFRK